MKTKCKSVENLCIQLSSFTPLILFIACSFCFSLSSPVFSLFPFAQRHQPLKPLWWGSLRRPSIPAVDQLNVLRFFSSTVILWCEYRIVNNILSLLVFHPTANSTLELSHSVWILKSHRRILILDFNFKANNN